MLFKIIGMLFLILAGKWVELFLLFYLAGCGRIIFLGGNALGAVWSLVSTYDELSPRGFPYV